mmetsp:Transcript_120/g.258  ORF Transcript_120/g.258 Transcript_120/m.258 type:complete len:337 (-) Transcript_120:264-1274(-)
MMDQGEHPGGNSLGPRKRSTFHGYEASSCTRRDDDTRPKVFVFRGYYHWGDHCWPLFLVDEEERLSFLISYGSYFWGALLGVVAAILDLRSAMKHLDDGDDSDDDNYSDEWIYRAVLWKWDTMKLLGVCSTSFYLISSFSDFACDGSGCRKSYAKWFRTILFSSGAILDLSSSILTGPSYSDDATDYRILNFLSKESWRLCADLFFASAFFQVWGRSHLYFPQSKEREALRIANVNLVADAFFFFGTLIDVVYANGIISGTTKSRDWFYGSILGLFSAMFWLANSILSVVGDVMGMEYFAEEEEENESFEGDPSSDTSVTVRSTGVADDLKFYVLL